MVLMDNMDPARPHWFNDILIFGYGNLTPVIFANFPDPVFFLKMIFSVSTSNPPRKRYKLVKFCSMPKNTEKFDFSAHSMGKG